MLGSQQGQALLGTLVLLAFGWSHLLEPGVLTTRMASPGAATVHQKFPPAAPISSVPGCDQADPENMGVWPLAPGDAMGQSLRKEPSGDFLNLYSKNVRPEEIAG